MATLFNCNICGSPAIITKTERPHVDFQKCYCKCKNELCQHRFVMNITFDKTLQASLLQKDELIKTLLSKLPQNEQQNLIAYLQKSMTPNS